MPYFLVKHKYSLNEMMNYFEYLNNKKIYDARPRFVHYIEEICSSKKKIFNSIHKVRDRSNTLYSTNNNFSNQFKKGLKEDNEKRMSFNYTSNRLENFKIPNNNPLANMNNFNKFDDPNLNINVMNLSINSISFENN